MGLFGKKKVKEEGLIEEYGVIYKGGHPKYPKAKVGKISFKIFEDRFVFESTLGSKKWFEGIDIRYERTKSLDIVERQVGSVEGILGGLNSRQLNQKNNIHIVYLDESDLEIILRLEMMSGITVMGQAGKCLELLDRINTNKISDKFMMSSSDNVEHSASDIPTQIEKLAKLKESGIINDEEFTKKKKELLDRM